jgi:hypothetical protein
MAQKTLIGSISVNDRWQKTAIRLMVVRGKKILSQWIGPIDQKFNGFLRMIGTIGQTSTIFCDGSIPLV